MRITKARRIENLPVKGLWSSIRVCPCCGNFVVKLRVADQKRRFKICFFNGWDGNPWFTPAERLQGNQWVRGNAVPHNPKKGWGLRPRSGETAQKSGKAEDSFFSLDSE